MARLDRRTWRWFWWRLGLLVASFSCALSAFLLGVGTSDRPGIPEADLPTKLYYALGLFVFGGLDLGVPRGGPAPGRALLWLAYFASPAITAAALVEAVLRLLRPDLWRLRRLRDHVVIAGGGELALLYLEELRRVAPERPVVVLEVDPDAAARLEEVCRADRVHVLTGDATTPRLLERVRLEAASRLLLLTGDDLANAEIAHEAARRAPGLGERMVIHVGDVNLMRDLERAGLAWAPGLFNSHQVAAAHVVERLLLPAFAATEDLDRAVIGGFGRFGQSLLVELQARAGQRVQQVVVIDRDAARNLRILRQQVPLEGALAVTAVDGDLRDPAVWETVRANLGPRPVFVLGSDDDAVNLHVALWLARDHPDALTLARSMRHSAFLHHMAERHGFRAAVVSTHLRESMREDPRFGIAPARAEPESCS